MKPLFGFGSVAALAAFASLAAGPASAGVKTVDGQSYWSGDPGPLSPGACWNGGQQHFDPDHYLSWYGYNPRDYRMTVYAAYSGGKGCVSRQRVINSDWELRHPYIRVCD